MIGIGFALIFAIVFVVCMSIRPNAAGVPLP